MKNHIEIRPLANKREGEFLFVIFSTSFFMRTAHVFTFGYDHTASIIIKMERGNNVGENKTKEDKKDVVRWSLMRENRRLLAPSRGE